ncbi:hypothetical protein ACYSNU_16680 [Enterococcus sp. LJL120]
MLDQAIIKYVASLAVKRHKIVMRLFETLQKPTAEELIEIEWIRCKLRLIDRMQKATWIKTET